MQASRLVLQSVSILLSQGFSISLHIANFQTPCYLKPLLLLIISVASSPHKNSQQGGQCHHCQLEDVPREVRKINQENSHCCSTLPLTLAAEENSKHISECRTWIPSPFLSTGELSMPASLLALKGDLFTFPDVFFELILYGDFLLKKVLYSPLYSFWWPLFAFFKF